MLTGILFVLNTGIPGVSENAKGKGISMRIIDTHVHVLDNYAPVDPDQERGENWFEGRCERLLQHMDECGVEKAVLVPVVAAYSPHNNEECAHLARVHPDRLATLVDVQLDNPDAAEQVARAREEFGAVGISYYPPDGNLSWMVQPDREPLWEAFRSCGQVCNLQIRPPDYPVLLRLARTYPDIRFVSNHLGLPAHLFNPDEPSYGGLLEGESPSNLFVKASGFYAAAATPWDFRCPRILGFIARLLDGLGTDRVLWGSDWPPAALHLTYRQNLELVRSFVESLDHGGRTLVLGENAARVYGI